MSPTQWCAQACGQPSRWSFRLGDLVAEALFEVPDERVERVFVSVTAKLQCGSPVQASEVTRTRLTSSGKPISASAATGVDAGLGDVRDDEVLLPGQADVAAEALRQLGDREHLVAGHEPEVHGDADVCQARLLLRVHADVVAEQLDRRRLVIGQPAAEALLHRARIPSGP